MLGYAQQSWLYYFIKINQPMNYTLAAGSSIHQMVSLIMLAKPLDVIVGQPTTKSMNKMMEQMAQMVAPVKTFTWGGQRGLLALVLDNMDYTHNIATTL